jgi:LysM repeat protein
MCGYDLRIRPKRKQRISWVDALLVLAVIVVLGFWWQIGGQTTAPEEAESLEAISASEIPQLGPTPTPTLTPIPTPTFTPLPPETVTVIHEVKAGENLLAIAGFYGVTVEELQQANNLSDEIIRIGQNLRIPVTRSATQQIEQIAPTETFNYRVLENDTVNSIAFTFGATIDDILQANNLAPEDIIRPGQVLLVPVRNVPGEVLENADSSPGGETITQGTFAQDDQNRIYIEPRLIGPPDQATIARESAILLRWTSVDILAPNEWYVLQVNPVDGDTRPLLPIWTKATTYRLEPELAPPQNSFARYAWQVSVVRVTVGTEGNRQLEPTSPISELRMFTWQ